MNQMVEARGEGSRINAMKYNPFKQPESETRIQK